MDPRSASASILQRGAGQRGRHGAPGALGWSGGQRGKRKPEHRGGPRAGGRRCFAAAVTAGDGERAGPARGGEGKERGRDARRERGAGPHAKKAAALSHSLRAAEARAGPGQGKGSGGLSPASPGRPWRPRPLHRPAGAATARAAGPRSLQQPRPPRAEPETLLLFFFFSCYCSCCPRPTAAAPPGHRRAESGWRPAGRTERSRRGRPATPRR